MKIHIILHESFEAPAAILTWAKNKGHEVSYSKVYRGDALPKDADDFDFLIIMGGPQSPATTLKECSYFNAQAEIAFIKKAIAVHKLILGVCLGAQLIGEAYDAKFEHSPNKEIGMFKIKLTEDAKTDPIFSKFPQSFLVGHWHGDMPGVPSHAKILAKSEGCPRQIVAYGQGVYGFQCHFEFTKDAIEKMIKNCQHELDDLQGLPYVQSTEQLRANDYQNMNQLLFRFLDEMEKLKL